MREWGGRSHKEVGYLVGKGGIFARHRGVGRGGGGTGGPHTATQERSGCKIEILARREECALKKRFFSVLFNICKRVSLFVSKQLLASFKVRYHSLIFSFLTAV